ncbi:hypothetical protein [Albibacterium sp.]|uniref:hypothetical protein n=1 Tax=Albibacterium sp. TaxID=2952885 RepID=UPI002CEA44D7|nr:hypothetical protein [Albibacterium sp.]HUH19336.1 hypothetical protein [Albibacterium sp.]
MMTSRWRWIIIVIAMLLLAWAVYHRSYQVGSLLIAIVAYMVWSHFKEGTVVLASEAFQNKEYDKARKLLADIKNPEYLRRRRRSYYEFINGNLYLQLLDDSSAERHFQLASRLPFRRPNDKAIVFVHLANINLRKKDYERVRAYLAKASEIEVSSRIAQIINRIENEIPKK